MLSLSLSIPSIATLGKGVPFWKLVNGVLCERVTLDGLFVDIDGQPVYMEI